MSELEKYLKSDSIQKEDDLVFPTQDYLTLYMNIQKYLKKDYTFRKEVREFYNEK